MEEARVYTVDEAAEYLKMSPDFIREQVRKRTLGCYRCGRSVRFSKDHLENFLSDCEKKVIHE